MPKMITKDMAADAVRAKHGGRVALCGPYAGVSGNSEFACSQGHRFTAQVREIIRGKGCRQCADLARGRRYRRTTHEVAREIFSIHGAAVQMTGSYLKGGKLTEFKCDEGHVWRATPLNVLRRKSGCPFCAKRGFDRSKPGRVYYICIDHDSGPLYKIGITNEENAIDRFRHLRDRGVISLVKEWEFEVGEEALRFEQSLLRRHAADRYQGPPVLKGGGNTEIFTRDIFAGV